MDKYGEAIYRNQFNAPLDAKALLGDQLVNQPEITWSEVEYVGSALSDAEILLGLVTEDWAEQALLFMPNSFTAWAMGKAKWDDHRDDARPWLGCNNDRMAHVPKGVIGVRMDGTDSVVFNGLEISNVHEYSELGSDVCGRYWDGNFNGFTGGGNTLQNAPYLYGYTGNRAHGLFVCSVLAQDADMSDMSGC